MKRAALSLAVLSVLALAASTASAAPHGNGPHGNAPQVSLVAHGGWGSPHHGHHGRPGPSWHHGPRLYPHPPLYRPPVVLPVPRPAPCHVYRYYQPPYYPGASLSYYGKGFGISIGF